MNNDIMYKQSISWTIDEIKSLPLRIERGTTACLRWAESPLIYNWIRFVVKLKHGNNNIGCSLYLTFPIGKSFFKAFVYLKDQRTLMNKYIKESHPHDTNIFPPNDFLPNYTRTAKSNLLVLYKSNFLKDLIFLI